MQRRFAYALTAGALSWGAPLGLLWLRLRRNGTGAGLTRGVREEIAADRQTYTYITASTALVFSVFGYVVGSQADRLAELSETDPLTRLSNVRGLFDRLDTEIARARRYGDPVALVLLDLDGLKRINDRHGHWAGDLALRRVGDVIRTELRDTDLGARWGGDEFAIVAPKTKHEAAVALAERIRAAIAREADPWHTTVSVGVASLDPAHGAVGFDPMTLMRAADAALYDAKRQGRNRVVEAPRCEG